MKVDEKEVFDIESLSDKIDWRSKPVLSEEDKARLIEEKINRAKNYYETYQKFNRFMM